MMRRLISKQSFRVILIAAVILAFSASPSHAGLWDSFVDAVSDAWDTVTNAVEEAVETVVEVVEEVVDAVVEYVVDKIVRVELVHGRIEQCPLVPELEQEYQECWTCTVFMMFFDASNAMAAEIAKIVEGPAINLLWAMFLVWLVFNVAVFFSSVGDTPDLGEFATKVGGMIFKVLFGVCFLSAGSALTFEYFISPVLTDAANLANTLVDKPLKPGGDKLITVTPPKPVLSGSTGQAMNGMVGALGDGLRNAQAIAQALRCGSGYWAKVEGALAPLLEKLGIAYFPNPVMWAFGCFLGGVLWVIALIFPMVLMDAVFRIGLVLGMLPIFVVAWVFPATKQYASTAFFIVLHSCILFSVMAIVMNICVSMIMLGIENMSPEFLNHMNAGAYVDAFIEMSTGASFGKIMVLIAICFFGILIPPKSETLASQFSGQEFPPSVGMEALGMMVNLVIDIIILIITLITLGCGSLLYIFRVAQLMAKSEKMVRVMRKIMKLAELTRKRAKQMQRLAKQSKIKGGNSVSQFIQ